MEPLILTDAVKCDNCGMIAIAHRVYTEQRKDTHQKAQKNTK